MNQTLLACLLALAISVQAQARGACADWATASSGVSQQAAAPRALPAGEAPSAQDTSRFGNAQEARIAVVGFRPRASRPRAAYQPATQPDSSAVAYLDATGAFNPDAVNLPATLAIALRRPAAPLGRPTYRTRLVRTGRFSTRREAVEILTCTYAGPLVLAQLPAAEVTSTQVLAGPGYDPTVALRPLALTQEAVLQLCGDRAPQVLAYAQLYNLHFQQAHDVARLLDYYNRIAVVK